ncbi:MAG: hypothetical protein OXE79_07305 [Acidimicrobiaceae bacterium]|nr:hypothetical protein [Acidimicrobiaceae bacterium]MCY4280828.1 hypothetical protein [Acidimicrobiaceae bacterium]
MNDRQTAIARNPSAEAASAAGDGYQVRVLEPSPPAVTSEPFFADDPAHMDPRGAAGGPVVTPHSGGDLSWDDLIAQQRPDLADFAAERWLGARRQLPDLPTGYPDSLMDYHRLAYSVVAEARHRSNGKFGLRYVRGGFGTPFFGDDVQVRVDGDQLVVQRGDRVQTAGITTLRAAGEFVGVAPGVTAAEHDSPELGDLDRPLDASSAVGGFLGAWFGLATAALEELRFTPGVIDPERVQLWPGHLDPAMAAGDAAGGGRATFGFSPGDHAHDEPYVYAAAWGDVDRSEGFWNETNFNGASLPWRELSEADDHYRAAVDFLKHAYSLLNL